MLNKDLIEMLHNLIHFDWRIFILQLLKWFLIILMGLWSLILIMHYLGDLLHKMRWCLFKLCKKAIWFLAYNSYIYFIKIGMIEPFQYLAFQMNYLLLLSRKNKQIQNNDIYHLIVKINLFIKFYERWQNRSFIVNKNENKMIFS